MKITPENRLPRCSPQGADGLAGFDGQHQDIRSLSLSPDGHLLAAASGDTEVRLWDVSDRARPGRLPPLKGHTAFVPAVAFSPDGNTLATGSHDGTLKLWNVALGQEVATLRGHSAIVHCVAWSPDGNTIFTGGGDATSADMARPNIRRNRQGGSRHWQKSVITSPQTTTHKLNLIL